MLNIHSDACANSSCECRDLKMALWKGTDVLEFQTSTKAYITRYDRTDVWQKGCLNRVLRLILGELEPHFARSNQFCVMLAEIYFYYLANFYYAWEQISIVKQRKPSVMLQQRIYNLSRMIHSGMECDEDEDLERTTESIDYLKYYNNFLEQIEESTELTIKFWTILLDDRPSSQRLNELGKALFESKYLIMQIVQEISKITSNQVEFLVRYGLFMKYVMHDASSAEQAFKRIYHSQESSLLSFSHTRRFSIFRGDVGVMLVIGSLESSTNATICEINNETEKKLGYTREEMLGSPVTMLMSPIVSQCHERLVQTFFRTLNSNTFATAKIRFIKRSDGTYLACDSFKKVVPRLSDGLQVALFMIATPSISGYTCYKQDATKRKAGAVLCDSTYKITGLNREAMESLRIDETCVKDILRNTSALDAFPQLNDPAIMEAATRKEGVVIATPKFELQMERDEDLMILTKNEGATRLSSGEGTLTWIRMVHETYSETDKANVLIMAEVLQENRDKYTARKDLPGVYVNNSRRLPEIVREKVQVTASEATGDKGTNAENYQRLSDAGSMISVASVSVNGSSDTSNNRMMNISNELTMRNAVNKQTPASIVKLYAVIIALLVVIAILIGTHAIDYLGCNSGQCGGGDKCDKPADRTL
ncbi:MAG: PAS domain-containing protein [Candidatus Pacebacteria bacterium]|nr:PAS domain-containing protein [Candidatus Paceibacterota bacterium]